MYLYGIVFPYNRQDIREYTRDTDLSLVLSASPDFALWGATDGRYDLDMKMTAYQRELQLLRQSLSFSAMLHLVTAFATPQTKFKLVLSKGFQVLTQRLAKGKKIDTSDNPVVRRRRMALH